MFFNFELKYGLAVFDMEKRSTVIAIEAYQPKRAKLLLATKVTTDHLS